MWQNQDIELGSGRSLFALQAGDGPDLVLIHGALGTSHDWRVSPAAADLVRDHRVTIVDRPGHGRSRRPRFVGTPRHQARQIAEGLERMGVERPVIAGHSFGALVTLAFAEQMPERLAAMVLVAPLAFPEPRLLEHLFFAPRSLPLSGPLFSQFAARSLLDRAFLPAVQRLMFFPQPVPAGWKESFPVDRILAAEALVYEGEDAASMLPFSPAGMIDIANIRTETRIIAGSGDRIVEHERQAKALARRLPNAQLIEIDRGGHMLHHSHSGEVTEAIRAALAPA